MRAWSAGLRRRLAQGLRENGNGEIVVLELGEEEEGLCAQRAALRSRPADRW